MSGSTIEPYFSVLFANVEGYGSAILPGSYNIIEAIGNQRYSFYLDGVSGRTGIALHGGFSPEDSLGCIIIGNGSSLQEFYDFLLENWGSGEIRVFIK